MAINIPVEGRQTSTMLGEIYEGGKVRRWHTSRAFGDQTNADHSWGVAVILMLIFPDCSVNLLKAALLHDLPERYTGDLPSQAKHEFAPLKEAVKKLEEGFFKTYNVPFPVLTEKEKRWLAIADQMEAYLFISKSHRQIEIERAAQILEANINAMQEEGARN